MPLPVPRIDERDYAQIMTEVLARIPAHTPEWTNYDDSDPGVTLLQLFAFMTESIIYRVNLIPERLQRQFLSLLDIPMRAAAPAQGFVVFDNLKGALRAELLPAGTELNAGQVAFRTLNGLEVLPLEARAYYRRSVTGTRRDEIDDLYQQLYASYTAPDVTLDYYDTVPLDPPSPGGDLPSLNLTELNDRALWVALLAPSEKPAVLTQTLDAIANRILTLAVLPAVSEAGRNLPPAGTAETTDRPTLVFEVPVLPAGATTLTRDAEGNPIVQYRTLDFQASTDLLLEPGLVQIELPSDDVIDHWRIISESLDPLERGVDTLPPSLDDNVIQARVLTWLRIRVKTPDTPTAVNARLSWVGINAAQVVQRVDVPIEDLGRGTGEPDQVVRLANTPVIPQSLRLIVNNELWQATDDLATSALRAHQAAVATAPKAVASTAALDLMKFYKLDPVTGEIQFGFARPPRRAVIRASYAYGGGRQGNVGIGVINKGAALPAGMKVTNPVRTWGGSDPETVQAAEKRMADVLRHRDRLVSQEDFRQIVRETPGVDIGRVEVLASIHPDEPDIPAPGVVTVMVIPRYDLLQPDAPRPDRLFLDTVCAYIEPRRLITTELFVRGPEYVPVWASIGFDIVPGADVAIVREAIKTSLRRFLSPLVGGNLGRGWPLNKDVDALELAAVAARVSGVARVQPVLLTDDSGNAMQSVSIAGLKLPRLVAVAAQQGLPQPLAELIGAADETTGPGGRVLPVPVVPPECD